MKVSEICRFCGETVSEVNRRVLRQHVFKRLDGRVLTQERTEKRIVAHSVCGLPDTIDAEIETEACLFTCEVEEPRHVIYVDVGDLPHEDARLYLEAVSEALRKKKGDDAFVQGYRLTKD